MSWMSAIATDVEELVMTIGTAPAFEQVADGGRTAGWIPPTEPRLACSLITSGQLADLERARRILGGK